MRDEEKWSSILTQELGKTLPWKRFGSGEEDVLAEMSKAL